MRHSILLFSLVLLASLKVLAQSAGASTDTVPSLTEKLLKSLGGKALWQNTRTLYLKEWMWAKQSSEEIQQEIWRDLKFPGTKLHLTSKSMDRTRAWDAKQGWGILENGKSYLFDSIRVKTECRAWNANLFTVCYKLANKDPNLIIHEKDGEIIQVYNQSQELICTIELNASGAPIKWSAPIGEAIESYIYGPLQSFGPYNLPSWWTSPDGRWQFKYIEFKSSLKAPEISFLPPKEFNNKK